MRLPENRFNIAPQPQTRVRFTSLIVADRAPSRRGGGNLRHNARYSRSSRRSASARPRRVTAIVKGSTQQCRYTTSNAGSADTSSRCSCGRARAPACAACGSEDLERLLSGFAVSSENTRAAEPEGRAEAPCQGSKDKAMAQYRVREASSRGALPQAPWRPRPAAPSAPGGVLRVLERFDALRQVEPAGHHRAHIHAAADERRRAPDRTGRSAIPSASPRRSRTAPTPASGCPRPWSSARSCRAAARASSRWECRSPNP